MKLSEFLIEKFTGRNDIKIDDIPLSYFFKKCIQFGKGLVRGKIKGIGIKNKGKNLVIGKSVKIYGKKYLKLGNNIRINEFTRIDALSKDGIMLGDSVKIGAYSTIIGSGTIKKVGKGLSIGENSSFSEYTFFGAAGGIEIGKNVIGGQNVRFHAENHNYNDLTVPIKDQGVNHKGIILGNDIWIGSGVVFLDGAHVSDGSVIAANAVVTGRFPENCIIGGMPAKIIKQRG